MGGEELLFGRKIAVPCLPNGRTIIYVLVMGDRGELDSLHIRFDIRTARCDNLLFSADYIGRVKFSGGPLIHLEFDSPPKMYLIKS